MQLGYVKQEKVIYAEPLKTVASTMVSWSAFPIWTEAKKEEEKEVLIVEKPEPAKDVKNEEMKSFIWADVSEDEECGVDEELSRTGRSHVFEDLEKDKEVVVVEDVWIDDAVLEDVEEQKVTHLEDLSICLDYFEEEYLADDEECYEDTSGLGILDPAEEMEIEDFDDMEASTEDEDFVHAVENLDKVNIFYENEQVIRAFMDAEVSHMGRWGVIKKNEMIKEAEVKKEAGMKEGVEDDTLEGGKDLIEEADEPKTGLAIMKVLMKGWCSQVLMSLLLSVAMQHVMRVQWCLLGRIVCKMIPQEELHVDECEGEYVDGSIQGVKEEIQGFEEGM